MVEIIQILFAVLIVVMAISNAIWILYELVMMICNPALLRQFIDCLFAVNPEEIAWKIVMQDSNDIEWDWDVFDTGVFDVFDC